MMVEIEGPGPDGQAHDNWNEAENHDDNGSDVINAYGR